MLCNMNIIKLYGTEHGCGLLSDINSLVRNYFVALVGKLTCQKFAAVLCLFLGQLFKALFQN